MRKLILAAAALLTFFVFFSDDALARLVSVSWISEDDLQARCTDLHGHWHSGKNGYSCGKKCSADYCVYACSKGKQHNTCRGSVGLVSGQEPKNPTGKLTVERFFNFKFKAANTKGATKGKIPPIGILRGDGGIPSQQPGNVGAPAAAPASPPKKLY
jgi:hypothetical protein